MEYEKSNKTRLSFGLRVSGANEMTMKQFDDPIVIGTKAINHRPIRKA